jgi:hypothetical protein
MADDRFGLVGQALADIRGQVGRRNHLRLFFIPRARQPQDFIDLQTQLLGQER